jgi:hypothetical protein
MRRFQPLATSVFAVFRLLPPAGCLGLHPRRVSTGSDRCRSRGASVSRDARRRWGGGADVPSSGAGEHNIQAQVNAIFRRRGNAPVRDRHAYVIRNARLDPEWSSVDRRLLSITGRAISTMIYYSGYNDVFRIYASSQLDGIDFNLAYIGADFTTERKENFDQVYMRALFEYGYQQARNRYHWFKQPPVMDMPDGRPNVDAER